MKDFLENILDLKNTDFRLFAAALDASSNGVVITDHQQPDQPIIYCNKALNHSPDILENKSLDTTAGFSNLMTVIRNL